MSPPRRRRVRRHLHADLHRRRRRHRQRPGHRRRRARERPRDRDHGLEPRPHLGRPLQPGDHARLPRDAADHAAARGRLLGRAVRRRARRGRDPARALHARRGSSPRCRTPRGFGAGKGFVARDHPHLLPRLGRVGDRGRSRRRVQVDRRPRDRAHDHDRRADGRPAHRRRDEPGARVRPAARRQLLGRGLDLLPRRRRSARSSRRSSTSISISGPQSPPVVGTPESGVAEPRPGDTALD